MAKVIVVDIRKCLACKSCEIACALEHSQSKVLEDATKESPRPQSRVMVESAGEHGLPIQCRHCEDAPCIRICPTGAISRERDRAPVTVDPELCIGCKLCVLVCPLGVLYIDHQGRAVIKCDMCYELVKEGKLPKCVEACPTTALQLLLLDEISEEKAAKGCYRKKTKG